MLSGQFHDILESLAIVPEALPEISWALQALENCFDIELFWLESFGKFAR